MVSVTPAKLIRVSVGSVTQVWPLSVTPAGQVPRGSDASQGSHS
jgi:hypothetical protein